DVFVWKKDLQKFLPDARNVMMEIPCKKFWQDLQKALPWKPMPEISCYIFWQLMFLCGRKINRNPLPDARNAMMEIPCKKFWQDLQKALPWKPMPEIPLLYILATDVFVWKKDLQKFLPDARNVMMEIPCKKFWQDLQKALPWKPMPEIPLLYILATDVFVWKKDLQKFLPDARNVMMEIPCKKFWQDLQKALPWKPMPEIPLLYILATDVFVWKKDLQKFLPDARNVMMEIPCKKFWQDLQKALPWKPMPEIPLLYILASSFSN
ncbi:hypothetical protein BgiBS90_030952, partial [Biomphalaria glabrata]